MINLQDFITQSNLFRKVQLGEVLLVEYKCLVEDHQSDIWAHQDYFAYVVGGEKKWETPLGSHKVGPGEILYVRKGAATVYQYFKEPFFVIFIFISDDFIRRVVLGENDQFINTAGPYLENNRLLLLDKHPVMDAYFKSLEVFFTQNQAMRDNLLALKMEELVLNIISLPGNRALKQHFVNMADGRRSSLAELMHANYLKAFAIKDFARMSGRSLASFRRDFRNEFNTPPGKWLLKKRLAHSRFLLHTTQKQIGEVLYASGFSNRAHFNKVFKKEYGCSPNEFRRNPVLV
jgi:AraC-like DNA-binding protein